MRKIALWVGMAGVFVANAPVMAGHDGAAATPCCQVATEGDDAGSACDEASEGRVATEGCLEDESGTCIGGTLNGKGNSGPAGCVCIGGSCATTSGPADAAACTQAATEGCCSSKACHDE